MRHGDKHNLIGFIKDDIQKTLTELEVVTSWRDVTMKRPLSHPEESQQAFKGSLKLGV